MSKKIYNVSTARIAATARRDRNNNGGVTGSVSVSGMVYNDYNISEKADKADLLALSTLVDSMFEWVPDDTLAEGGYIRAKANFASVGEITAMGAPGSGGTTPPTPTKVSDLQDVNVAGVANGMVLVYRNGYWVAETPQGGGIDTVQLASYLSQNNYVQQSALGDYYTRSESDGKYLPLSGGTLTGTLGVRDNMVAKVSSGVSKAAFGYNDSQGAYLYNYAKDYYIGIKDDGTPHFNGNTLLHSGNYSTTLDTRYVKKSGDEITGFLNVIAPFSVYSNDVTLGITANLTTSNYLGPIAAANNLINLGRDGARWANVYATTINVSSTALVSNLNADLLDGVHNGEVTARFISYKPFTNGSEIDFTSMGWSSNGACVDVPALGYKSGITIGMGYSRAWQIFSGRGNNHIYFRNAKEDMSGWNNSDIKTIAFLTDNVASASRLTTTASYSAWGQTFFANGVPQSVNGHLSIGTILGQQTAGQAELSVISETDVPVDIMLGRSGTKKWSITSRASSESDYFGIYNYTNGSFRLIIREDGTTCIGTTTPVAGAKLHVQGNIYSAGEVTATNTSDMRLKRNILPIQNAIGALKALGGYYTFDYLPEAVEREHNGRIGLLFQNVGGHFGELMRLSRNDGYGALNYLKPDYINLIGAATLENADEIEQLKRRVAALEEELERRVRA